MIITTIWDTPITRMEKQRISPVIPWICRRTLNLIIRPWWTRPLTVTTSNPLTWTFTAMERLLMLLTTTMGHYLTLIWKKAAPIITGPITSMIMWVILPLYIIRYRPLMPLSVMTICTVWLQPLTAVARVILLLMTITGTWPLPKRTVWPCLVKHLTIITASAAAVLHMTPGAIWPMSPVINTYGTGRII